MRSSLSNWYEELQIVVYSIPKNCPDCCKHICHRKNLNTELLELLKDGQLKEAGKLLRISTK
ncbi:MAG: hypothetical protein MRZ79_17485 [Bacteroidia bacterium]|nr:hypothetical protein [Bacteroidia bacterium]